MPALGSGINAALGRQDYSGIARGGEVIGQGMANAANIKMQGMMQLGQQIGSAVKDYKQKQEEKKKQLAAEGQLTQIIKGRPEVAKVFNISLDAEGNPDQKEVKVALAGANSPVDAINAALGIGQYITQQEQAAAQAAKAQQAEQQRQQITQALHMATDTDGRIVVDDFLSNANQFGVDPQSSSAIAENIRKAQPEKKESFIPTAGSVKTPSGRDIDFVSTSTGAVQIIPDEGDVKLPAGVRETIANKENWSKAEELFNSGRISETLQILRAMGVKDEFGGIIKASSLPDIFSQGGVDAQQESPSSYKNILEQINQEQ